MNEEEAALQARWTALCDDWISHLRSRTDLDQASLLAHEEILRGLNILPKKKSIVEELFAESPDRAEEDPPSPSTPKNVSSPFTPVFTANTFGHSATFSQPKFSPDVDDPDNASTTPRSHFRSHTTPRRPKASLKHSRKTASATRSNRTADDIDTNQIAPGTVKQDSSSNSNTATPIPPAHADAFSFGNWAQNLPQAPSPRRPIKKPVGGSLKGRSLKKPNLNAARSDSEHRGAERVADFEDDDNAALGDDSEHRDGTPPQQSTDGAGAEDDDADDAEDAQELPPIHEAYPRNSAEALLLEVLRRRAPISIGAVPAVFMTAFSVPLEVPRGSTLKEYLTTIPSVVLTTDEQADVLNYLGPTPTSQQYKALGDDLYRTGKFIHAVKAYSNGIVLDSCTEVLFGNRSASYVALYGAEQNRTHLLNAVDDCNAALRLNPNYAKVHMRLADCLVLLGRLEEAKSSYIRVTNIPECPHIRDATVGISSVDMAIELKARFDTSERTKNFGDAIHTIEKLLVHCPEWTDLWISKVLTLIKLKRLSEALKFSREYHTNDSNPEWLYLQGLVLYNTPNSLSEAIKAFHAALTLQPSHAKSAEMIQKASRMQDEKFAGNEAYKMGRLAASVAAYTTALEIDTQLDWFRAVLFANRAAAHVSLNNNEEAIEDCTDALKLDPNYTKAYTRRAQCFLNVGLFEEAMKDCEIALEMDPTSEAGHRKQPNENCHFGF
eukprot:c20361_g1_i1.p1 GENE.c20361_g1_i1~~c20361_g1_i1.p1  ORF type:complete len:736 (+),score=153.11 c20361_g1_i1:44-2209(+)